jgi:hypothetical protein
MAIADMGKLKLLGAENSMSVFWMGNGWVLTVSVYDVYLHSLESAIEGQIIYFSCMSVSRCGHVVYARC